jgi:hypothetical protein
MSDEQRQTLTHAPTLYEHYCEVDGCKKWGALGYDVGRGETRWFCFEHRWHEYPMPKGNAA